MNAYRRTKPNCRVSLPVACALCTLSASDMRPTQMNEGGVWDIAPRPLLLARQPAKRPHCSAWCSVEPHVKKRPMCSQRETDKTDFVMDRVPHLYDTFIESNQSGIFPVFFFMFSLWAYIVHVFSFILCPVGNYYQLKKLHKSNLKKKKRWTQMKNFVVCLYWLRLCIVQDFFFKFNIIDRKSIVTEWEFCLIC